MQNPSTPLPSEDPLEPGHPSPPYLRFVAPPPLRFEDPAPPPDLSAHPPAGAPPKQSGQKKDGAEIVLAKVSLPSTPAEAAARSAQATIVARSAEAAAARSTEAAAAPRVPAAAPLLPDDVSPQVRPEDFLPYFQYPGTASRQRGADMPPAPTIPPSTATYQQQ